MNKAGLIERLVAKVDGLNKKQAEGALDVLVATIIDELRHGRKVNIVGFGSFEAKTRHPRGGINPQHPNQRISIPEITVAKFKTGKSLKDALKYKKSATADSEPENESSDEPPTAADTE